MEESKPDQEEKRHVYVSVAQRETYGGWWAAGRKWEPGQHEADLTLKEIDNLSGRAGVIVVDADSGKAYGKSSKSSVAVSERLSADEKLALEDFRRAKARNPE